MVLGKVRRSVARQDKAWFQTGRGPVKPDAAKLCLAWFLVNNKNLKKEKNIMTKVIEVENLTITKPSIYEVTIKGMGSILFNKLPDLSISKAEKKAQAKVDPIDVERATWREKAYCYGDGSMFIPGENIHQCMKDGCSYWGQKIPGAGNKTYTDLIASGCVVENLDLGINKDDECVIPFGKEVNRNPSKGKKSGCRVYKIRPLLSSWGGTFKMHVFDARLTPQILQTIIAYSGTFRGLCDWRPTYGRFELIRLQKN
jgi:hypothetical protein